MSNDKQTVFQIRIQSELKEAFKAECLRQYKNAFRRFKGSDVRMAAKTKRIGVVGTD